MRTPAPPVSGPVSAPASVPVSVPASVPITVPASVPSSFPASVPMSAPASVAALAIMSTPPPRWRLAAARAPARRRGRGRWTVAIATLIALALLAPLWLVVLDAGSAGWSEIQHELLRSRSAVLLRNTVVLAAIVVVLAASVGVATAWCTERTRLPLRRMWRVLVVLPVAVPDEVSGYAWHTLSPSMNALLGSALVMTLTTYPFVYLPVAAYLRRSDPAMQETAHSLGAGRLRTFWRVTFPLIRTPVIGGCVLVALTLFAEYGSFEILRYQTFTTEIFTIFQFNPAAAGALALPLVALALLVLSLDAFVPTRVLTRSAPVRVTRPSGWGWRSLAMLAGLGSLFALGVGVPFATIIYWMTRSQHTTLPAASTLSAASWNTFIYSALGAGIAVMLALPVAMMSFRRSSAVRMLLERATFVTLALPGVVVALSLVYFATRYAYGIYQTSLLVICAYAIMHFPLALVCVKTSAVQTSAQMVDVGHSLGRGRLLVFFRVTLPLLAPGALAGFCLVFLMAATELTATLVLAPIGVMTLATQFWAYQSEVAYGAAAPYALVMMLMAVIPAAFLAAWFDRGPNAMPKMTP